MYLPLAVLLLALGAFTALVVARIKPGRQPQAKLDQLRGFGYVGAVGVGLVAVAVLILGLVARNPRLADGVALLGLFGYLAYQLAALVIITWPAARWPRRP